MIISVPVQTTAAPGTGTNVPFGAAVVVLQLSAIGL
jgi:hypothetical protein